MTQKLILFYSILLMAFMSCERDHTSTTNSSDTTSQTIETDSCTTFSETYFGDGKYQKVISICEKSRKESGYSALNNLMLGKSWFALGEIQRAQACINLSLRYDPNSAEAWFMAGKVAMLRDDSVGCRLYFRKADSLQPGILSEEESIIWK